MRKFIISLLMLVMVWTVIDKYVMGSNSGLLYTYILENREGDRELYQTKIEREGVFIVGDKVKIDRETDGLLSTKTIQRVK